MANGGRWTIVMLVLAVAGIVALWPRGGPDDSPGPPPDPSSLGSSPSPGADTDLASLRQRAALRPCPSPGQDASRQAGPVAGVAARCLGAPGAVDVGAALARKATLLNVWASWCVPCREEMPVLADHADRPGSVPVLGVNVQEPASAGLEFLAEVGVRYPSLHDGDESVQRAPPVLPLNYLVRPDGSVERITDPPAFRRPVEVRAALDHHLGSATGSS